MLSLILCGQPFRPPGSPASETLEMKRRLKNQISDAKSVEIIVLALKTLGTFDFKGVVIIMIGLPFLFFQKDYFMLTFNCILLGHILNEFVKDCVIYYLEQDN